MVGVSLRTETYARGRTVHTLTDCPFCGYDFDRDERRHKHLSEHDPEDAGLSPLGERPDSHDRERDAAVTVTRGPSDLSPSDARHLINRGEERGRND